MPVNRKLRKACPAVWLGEMVAMGTGLLGNSGPTWMEFHCEDPRALGSVVLGIFWVTLTVLRGPPGLDLAMWGGGHVMLGIE